MFKSLVLPLCILLASHMASADIISKTLSYEIDGKQYEGRVIYENNDALRPAVFMVPNWLGPTDQSAEKAENIARMGYVVFLADVYGVEVRPANQDEAREAATYLRQNRDVLRTRANAALQALQDNESDYPIRSGQYAAIGFCFGGGTVLEMARAGTDLPAFVSFHGNLDTPNPTDAQNIRGEILVLHGAIDPAVPEEQVKAFYKEMNEAGVDYTFVAYSNAVHSFTDPYANRPSYAKYQERAARQSFKMMHELFTRLFDD